MSQHRDACLFRPVKCPKVEKQYQKSRKEATVLTLGNVQLVVHLHWAAVHHPAAREGQTQPPPGGDHPAAGPHLEQDV